MHHKFVVFPFSAIVGQELLKKALLINAIDPSIGGVLIKGDKGTGKSTAVRALAYSLPKIKIVADCPFQCHPEILKLMCKSCQHRFEQGEKLAGKEKGMEIVDMPLSATEDMVVGSIDIKRVLTDGIKALEPGILARANRNILYIDEVNLLDDHLINILLDAAAMGVNSIEREGISLYHPARFMLVGTMNPEEGELRPQILDRFGLCVDVQALTDKDLRLEVIRRRKQFDRDCWEFEAAYRGGQKKLHGAIVKAQKLLPNVVMSDGNLENIVEITSGLGIKTHRADIVIEKTACALAALAGRRQVIHDDIISAALLALPHRMKQQPFEKTAPLDRQQMEQLLQQQEQEDIAPLEKQGALKKNFARLNSQALTRGSETRRETAEQGLYIRAQESSRPVSIAVLPTIKKAVAGTGGLSVLPEHLMEKVRSGKGECLYIIVLDSSSSMRMDKKVRLAKTLSWQVLKESYEKRNRLALIVFRGDEARLTAAPTRNYERIQDILEKLPSGGKTPLTPALFRAFELAKKEQRAAVTIVLISDGRANVFATGSLEGDIAQLEKILRKPDLIIVNAEARHRSIGTLENLAQCFQARHLYLEETL
ncbi:MAG: VWA domain-containing protein [Deltaproteobacteria bacterium]|nr:VWA domain-containing protein [Deltaproteobacteria bacterium]